MNAAIETAINELREAISSYQTYCHFVERGTLLVNADDDPADVIEAARLNVESCISTSVGRWDSPITKSSTSSPVTVAELDASST